MRRTEEKVSLAGIIMTFRLAVACRLARCPPGELPDQFYPFDSIFCLNALSNRICAQHPVRFPWKLFRFIDRHFNNLANDAAAT